MIEVRLENLRELMVEDRLLPGKAIRIEAAGNVFQSAGPALICTQMTKEPLNPADQEKLLVRLVAWKERDNLYSLKRPFLVLAHQGTLEPLAEKITTLDDWHKLWGITGRTGAIAGVRFRGVLDRSRIDHATRADFRLAPGSPGKGKGPGGKDIGADVARIGPGKPYHDWKKTTDYAAWQKKVRALLDGKKP
jgi:hypothetical protein